MKEAEVPSGALVDSFGFSLRSKAKTIPSGYVKIAIENDHL